MIRLQGQCRCGVCRLDVALSQPPENYQPRACDCDYCMARDAAWFSDPQGRLSIRSELALKSERQGSEQADFLSCPQCGQLVAVCLRDADVQYAAANSRLFPDAAWGQVVSASPKQLDASNKVSRWRRLWFSRFECTR